MGAFWLQSQTRSHPLARFLFPPQVTLVRNQPLIDFIQALITPIPVLGVGTVGILHKPLVDGKVSLFRTGRSAPAGYPSR